MRKESRMFKNKGEQEEKLCPWCYKAGVKFVAMSRSVKQECANKCGYYAWTPKKLLKKQEKKQFYTRLPHPATS